jgi:hypothetical protein
MLTVDGKVLAADYEMDVSQRTGSAARRRVSTGALFMTRSLQPVVTQYDGLPGD